MRRVTTNRAATVRERVLLARPDRLLTGAALIRLFKHWLRAAWPRSRSHAR